MAIPFYEPKNQEDNLQNQQQPSQMLPQQQQYYEEVDQVDGPALSSPPNIPVNVMPSYSPPPTTEHDVMAWKLLALSMCKALKDHYQQNMSSSTAESSSTAVIQILPNGQVKPSWN